MIAISLGLVRPTAVIVGSLIALAACSPGERRILIDISNVESLALLHEDRPYTIIITGPGISEQALRPLARLKVVRSLHLVDLPNIDGAFLRSLDSFHAIRTLVLIDFPMNDQLMEAIADMTNLESLRLKSVHEPPRELAPLPPLATLNWLGLNGWKLSSDLGKSVGAMRNLRRLDIYGNDNLSAFLDGFPGGGHVRTLDLGNWVEPHIFRRFIDWEHLRLVFLGTADSERLSPSEDLAPTVEKLRRRGVTVTSDT